MAKVYAAVSDKGACIYVPDASAQHLYRIGNSVIGFSDTEFLRILEKLKGMDTKQIAGLITELPASSTTFVAEKNRLYKIENNQLIKVEGSGKTELGDLVSELYSKCAAGKAQFGLCSAKGSKVLFAPGTDIKARNEEYKDDDKRLDFNNRVYNVLITNLANRLEQSPKHYSIKEVLSNAAKIAKHEYDVFKLREQTQEIIDSFIGTSYSFFGMLWSKDILGDVEQSQKRLHYRKEDLQEILDRKLLGARSMIISLEGEESIQLLKRETGCEAKALRHAGYAVVHGEERDLQRLHNMLGSRQMMSPRLRKHFESSRWCWNKGIYIPEIIAEFTGKKYAGQQGLEEMWNLENIGAIEAQQTSAGANVNVGIIDTGVDYTHAELAQRFGKEKGWDFIRDNDEPFDYNKHGTHVAGITAGENTGVANKCRLYSLRVLDENGSGRLSSILEAVGWAINHKLDVINLSLGSPSRSEIEYEAFLKAMQAGLVITAAAGNEGYGPSYPAAYDCVLAVAAVDRSKEHAEFSNIWETNAISCPGVGVYSSIPGGYENLSGTSMASPHLAGAAAMARSMHSMGQDVFRELLEKTAEGLGNCQDPNNAAIYGAGLLRADKLVKEVKNATRAIYNRMQANRQQARVNP
ncbi:MAG: S8 family peptidase [Candidatus Woesearchaeota archaeon]